MQLLDDGTEASAGQFEELEASLHGFGFFGLVALVDRVVPCFPEPKVNTLLEPGSMDSPTTE